MSKQLRFRWLTNSPILTAVMWIGSMLLVIGVSNRLSVLLEDLQCAQQFRAAMENFISRPIPDTTVLAIFGALVGIYVAAQLGLYGKKFVEGVFRSVALIPIIVLILYSLQLLAGTCGVNSHFLNRYGNVFMIAIISLASVVLTAFAFYLVPREVALSTRLGKLMASTCLIASAGAFLAFIQLGALVVVRGWK